VTAQAEVCTTELPPLAYTYPTNLVEKVGFSKWTRLPTTLMGVVPTLNGLAFDLPTLRPPPTASP
jgi:hypothetical protein